MLFNRYFYSVLFVSRWEFFWCDKNSWFKCTCSKVACRRRLRGYAAFIGHWIWNDWSTISKAGVIISFILEVQGCCVWWHIGRRHVIQVDDFLCCRVFFFSFQVLLSFFHWHSFDGVKWLHPHFWHFRHNIPPKYTNKLRNVCMLIGNDQTADTKNYLAAIQLWYKNFNFHLI